MKEPHIGQVPAARKRCVGISLYVALCLLALPALSSVAFAGASAAQKRQAKSSPRTRSVREHKTVVRAGKTKTRKKEYRPYILGGNVGYLYGFGDVKTPVLRLYGSYQFLLRQNDLALLAGTGWRTGTGNSTSQDGLLGSIHSRWRVQAIPLFVGSDFRWHFSRKLRITAGANLIGLYTHYLFSVTNELGSISPESASASWAMGAELHTGLQWQAGPGLISTTLRYSSIRQSNKLSPVSGELGGLALVAGYEWLF